jgi:hypothetical protein
MSQITTVNSGALRRVTKPLESPIRLKSEWTELKEQAVLGYESGLLPRTIDTAQKAVTIAMMGKELGLSPMQSLCGIYVVNGMAALRGSLMLRLIYERVPGARITILTPPENADEECEVEMQRPNGKAQVFRFTLEDARKAGFLQKPIWQLHTATMLRWAAIRTGARIIFADAIAGCYMEDEIPSDAQQPHLKGSEAVVEKAEPLESEGQTNTPVVIPQARVRVCDLSHAKPVTEKQINRLFAIAHSKRWTRKQVASCLDRWFQMKEPQELRRAEYDRLCDFILANPSPSDFESLLEQSA